VSDANETVRRLYAVAAAAGHGDRMVATVDALDRAARGPVSVEALAVCLVYSIEARLAERIDAPGGADALASDLALAQVVEAIGGMVS